MRGHLVHILAKFKDFFSSQVQLPFSANYKVERIEKVSYLVKVGNENWHMGLFWPYKIIVSYTYTSSAHFSMKSLQVRKKRSKLKYNSNILQSKQLGTSRPVYTTPQFTPFSSD